MRDRDFLQRRLLTQDAMLAKVDDVLVNSDGPQPAYTLILGAGASSGIVPTAKEMLGFPDERTKLVHDKAIPFGLRRNEDNTSLPNNDPIGVVISGQPFTSSRNNVRSAGDDGRVR